MQKTKFKKAMGPFKVSVKMIVASCEIGIKVMMMDLCQRVLDHRGMHDEWKTSAIVLIFKGGCDEL